MQGWQAARRTNNHAEQQKLKRANRIIDEMVLIE
jgi:hypothetical protein